jgi:hypothetical protein
VIANRVGDGEAMGVCLPPLTGKARASIGEGALSAQLARDYEILDSTIARGKLDMRYPIRFQLKLGDLPKDLRSTSPLQFCFCWGRILEI